jgi:drug/metabolite transporter (DMT)-like permease
MLAAAGACVWMTCAGTAPPASAAAPSLTDVHFWRAALAALFNAGGYAFYLALVSRGSVATWCALVGLYVCGPVIYGVFVRGESRSARKLAGIGVCLVAGVVLGMSEREADGAASSGLGDALMYIVCIGMWMVCDSIAAFVGRDLHIFYVAAAGGVGFAGAAFCAALVGFAATSGGAELRTSAVAAAGGFSAPGALALLFFAQCCGVGAWFACVELGKLSEASAFLPVTSLYTVLSSILSAVFFGEAPSRLYYVGLPLAAAGIGLIMFAENDASKGVAVPDEAPCATAVERAGAGGGGVVAP